MVTLESRESGGSVSCSYTYLGATTLPSSESSHEAADAPFVHEGIIRSSAVSESHSLQNSSAIVTSTQSNRNGISIFQGYGASIALMVTCLDLQIYM